MQVRGRPHMGRPLKAGDDGSMYSAASCPALGGAPSNPGWCSEAWSVTSGWIIRTSGDYWVARLKRAMTANHVLRSHAPLVSCHARFLIAAFFAIAATAA